MPLPSSHSMSRHICTFQLARFGVTPGDHLTSENKISPLKGVITNPSAWSIFVGGGKAGKTSAGYLLRTKSDGKDGFSAGEKQPHDSFKYEFCHRVKFLRRGGKEPVPRQLATIRV